MIHADVTIGDCRLLLGDCREVLPTLGRVDAVVTDPPYGLNYTPDSRKQIANDSRRSFARLLAILPDAIVRTGADRLAMFTRWDVWGQIFDRFGDLYPPCNCLVWDKNDTGRGNCNHMGNSHELVYVSAPANHVMRVNARRPLNIVRSSKVGTNDMAHPTEKPAEVMQFIVECMALPGELVCDPFMGSGTTGVACARLGRRFVGVEIEPRYFDIACRRIEEAYRQPRLFAEPRPQVV